MKKSLIVKIMGGALGVVLLLGTGLFASNSVTAGTAAQVENNKLSRGTWQLSVTDVKFKVGNSPTLKTAEVYTTIESTAGKDKVMLPKGYIIGIVGTSGKTYDIVVKDVINNIDRSFDVTLKNTEASRKAVAARKGIAFEQGVFLLAQNVPVDKAEVNIAAVIYEDENGNKSNIPIVGITPVTSQLLQGK